MIAVEKKVSKISYVVGFVSSLMGYSFREFLWNDSFYHLMALSFVCYTFALWNEAKNNVWKKITFIGLTACANNLTDELTGTACQFNFSEYLSFFIVAIYTFWGDRIKNLIHNFTKNLL